MTEEQNKKGWIRSFLPFLLMQKASLGITLAAALMAMLATAVAPTLMGMIVDDSILSNKRPLINMLAVLLAIGLFRFAIGFVRRYFGAKVGVGMDYELRNAIFEHLQRLDFTRHDQMQTGQLVSRANSDVQMLQRLMTMFPMMTSNVLLFPISLAFMIRISLPLSTIALFIVPLFLYLTIRMRKVVYPSSWEAMAKEADLAGVVDEAVTGVRVVKGFGQENRELNRLVSAAHNLFGARMRNLRISAKRQATMAMVPVFGQVAILAWGGTLAIRGSLSAGSFLAFLTYLVQLVAPVAMMAQMFVIAQTGRASAERILEILESTPEVKEKEGALSLAPGSVRGQLSFENAAFGYLRSQPVLKGLDLEVAGGETVALVGASGSGKSTVALLLPRFYDVQEGSVKIDGVDVRDVTLESLRQQIGVVFEDSFLFSDTIASNIAYGKPDATREEVEMAAKAAEAHKFILHLPDGYDTVVGERGLSLSGGQRQRIALARAIITNPRILLLDDATSSIDVKVEEEIHATLRKLMVGRTTLLIAHRRSTLELADRIVVMKDGKVLDQGTHNELMERCAHYKMLLSGPGDEIDAVPADGAKTGAAAPATAGAGAGGSGAPPAAAASVLTALQNRAAAGAGAGAAAGAAGPRGGMRMGGGMGGGAGGGGMGGRAMALNMAPEELQELIDKLPPIVDEPKVDVDEQKKDHGGFHLLRFIEPYKKMLAIGVALVVANSLATLAGPAIIRWGFDHGIVRKDMGSLQLAVGGFIVAALTARTLQWFSNVYTGRVGQNMLMSLRIRVFAQLQRLGLDFYDQEMAGRIMTRMTSDINVMNQLLQSGLITSVVQITTFFGTFVILFTMNPKLAGFVMLTVPFLTAATLIYRKHSSVAYTRVREGISAVNANFQESISGIRVAQAFNRERANISGFQQVTGEYQEARLDSQRISSLYFPFVELMSVVANVVVLGAGARFVTQGGLTPGELIAFSLYIQQVFGPIQQLSSLFDSYQQAKAAMDKLREVLGQKTSIPEAENPVVPEHIEGDIKFEDVHFKYVTAVREALSGVNLHISPGESVALVGETGAGKSTMVKLLARFYDPTGGRIYIDGIPLDELSIEAYRKQLGYVPQEAFLFSGPLRDNIAYGKPDATEEEVLEAVEAVGAGDLVRSLPDGIDTELSERGRSLSAGQRQLIALARALLVDPAILILDEATANLDLNTEAKVNRAMGVVAEGRTTVLIAHRLPTAHRADRIIVIGDGRVLEEGAPDDLVERGGHYARMWATYHGESAPAAVAAGNGSSNGRDADAAREQAGAERPSGAPAT